MVQRAVPPGRPQTALGSQLAIAVLGVICCATALGATDPMTACDRTADLQSLEVPVGDLSSIAAGHVIADPDDQDDAAIDVLPAQSQSEVPILYLAPRVAVILQDVFSAVAIETPSSNSVEQPSVIESTAIEETPLSPVAGDASQSDSTEHTDIASSIEDVDTVPGIERQMFRTDI